MRTSTKVEIYTSYRKLRGAAALLALAAGCESEPERGSYSLLIVDFAAPPQDVPNFSRLSLESDSSVAEKAGRSMARTWSDEWFPLTVSRTRGTTAQIKAFDASDQLVGLATVGPLDIPLGGAVVVPVTLERAPGVFPVKRDGQPVLPEPDRIDLFLNSGPIQRFTDSRESVCRYISEDGASIALSPDNMTIVSGPGAALTVVNEHCALTFDLVGRTARLRPGQTCIVPNETTRKPVKVAILVGLMRLYVATTFCAGDTVPPMCQPETRLDLLLAARSPADITGQLDWCIATTQIHFSRGTPEKP